MFAGVCKNLKEPRTAFEDLERDLTQRFKNIDTMKARTPSGSSLYLTLKLNPIILNPNKKKIKSNQIIQSMITGKMNGD